MSLYRKHHLIGTTIQQKSEIHQLLFELTDLRSNFTRICYNPKFLGLVPGYYDRLVINMPRLLMGSTGLSGFIMGGEKPSVADFVLYEYLQQNIYLIKSFPNGVFNKESRI